mmetsp:Transcript_4316/g.11267  ORF Transcript_4316/g.11267 Transcript_4316/m.11267 type:complete len:214 (-) Transcript_4316:2441-3082(-)
MRATSPRARLRLNRLSRVLSGRNYHNGSRTDHPSKLSECVSIGYNRAVRTATFKRRHGDPDRCPIRTAINAITSRAPSTLPVPLAHRTSHHAHHTCRARGVNFFLVTNWVKHKPLGCGVAANLRSVMALAGARAERERARRGGVRTSGKWHDRVRDGSCASRASPGFCDRPLLSASLLEHRGTDRGESEDDSGHVWALFRVLLPAAHNEARVG